jgi:drug/metabolite transporter (DMT)-like permease
MVAHHRALKLPVCTPRVPNPRVPTPGVSLRGVGDGKQPMSPQRIAGIAMVAIGAILLVVGFTASESMADQVSNFFTGRFTETTMWYLLGGTALVVVGVLLAALGGGRRSG